MKTITVLNALTINDYAFEKYFDQESAVVKSAKWAESVNECEKIIYLCSKDIAEKLKAELTPVKFNLSVDFKIFDSLTVTDLFSELSELSEGFDNIVYAYSDCPFLDKNYTDELYKLHTESFAEYSFADGYPEGMTPEILCQSVCSILASVCKGKKFDTTRVSRTSIFDALKIDINSFDIETLIANHDFRYLRYLFACDSKRNALLCLNAWKARGKDIALEAEKNPECLKTLPAYYSIQITTDVNNYCSYLPFKCDEKKFMQLKDFEKLIQKISEYSEDAVINLSYFSEAMRHPQVFDFIKTVLQYEKLSVLIETTGQNITEAFVSKVYEQVKQNPVRTNNYSPVYWIVSLDSVNQQMYEKFHGTPEINGGMNYEKAKAAYEIIKKYFQSDAYPQFTRTVDNEEQLEAFYRYWNAQGPEEKNGNLIIQKYDNYCGLLEDKKVADLRPLERNVCWQCRRELHINADFSVSLCRECVTKNIIGNAMTENLEDIFRKKNSYIQEQLNAVYKGICNKCDEYYTFNF
jgi:spiro-SPASM protein